jgi:hypothetical protein
MHPLAPEFRLPGVLFRAALEKFGEVLSVGGFDVMLEAGVQPPAEVAANFDILRMGARARGRGRGRNQTSGECQTRKQRNQFQHGAALSQSRDGLHLSTKWGEKKARYVQFIVIRRFRYALAKE